MGFLMESLKAPEQDGSTVPSKESEKEPEQGRAMDSKRVLAMVVLMPTPREYEKVLVMEAPKARAMGPWMVGDVEPPTGVPMVLTTV